VADTGPKALGFQVLEAGLNRFVVGCSALCQYRDSDAAKAWRLGGLDVGSGSVGIPVIQAWMFPNSDCFVGVCSSGGFFGVQGLACPQRDQRICGTGLSFSAVRRINRPNPERGESWENTRWGCWQGESHSRQNSLQPVNVAAVEDAWFAEVFETLECKCVPLKFNMVVC